jgi:tRNA1(Val) A37 N6-methylase TrmN6
VPPGDPLETSWAAGPGGSCDALSGHWRIYQLRAGHRYSLDDQLTADFAVESSAARGLVVESGLDLGCGIGSVLLMTAWRLSAARFVGVEAQGASAALARRSIAFNGVGARVEVRDADLRSIDLGGQRFDLVTGSPPYFPPGTGTVSARPQCEPCRFETRGGVEDYLRVAARYLAEGGLVAVCHAARERARVLAAGPAAGLRPWRVQEVVPRAGKPPLIALFAFVAAGVPVVLEELPALVVRDEAGVRTAEYRRVRDRMGFPP